MSLKKKLFQKIIGTIFSSLAHDQCIFGRCCNYFLCSLDPGQSIGNNYSVTRLTKIFLTQEKRIFSVLSKSNVDEAQIHVEISMLFAVFGHGTQLQKSGMHSEKLLNVSEFF